MKLVVELASFRRKALDSGYGSTSTMSVHGSLFAGRRRAEELG